jgi:hypothetical protein
MGWGSGLIVFYNIRCLLDSCLNLVLIAGFLSYYLPTLAILLAKPLGLYGYPHEDIGILGYFLELYRGRYVLG